MSYGDDDAWREVLAAVIGVGLMHGEKVMVVADGRPEDEVLGRLDDHTRIMVHARDRGQLVLSSVGTLIGPDLPYTPERHMGRLMEETGLAIRQGYTGLRTFTDMAWVQARAADIASMIHRETHTDHLFTDRPYSELCAYDRRWFPEGTLDFMCRAHPRNLLARLGELRAVHAGDSVRLIGEADLNTRDQFIEALNHGLARTTASRRLTVDLTQLCFLSTGCATGLLLACNAAGHELIEVHCDPSQAAALRRLGAGTVRQLALVEVRVRC
ncbi:MEDS domain-containing protein [Streptomyces thermocarboxydovorans]|uniref:MEDS domain-containing protein n=1 Tax=Streptomyces thermocarboxydovorans TaxID=59298 RepID=UPI0031CF29A7